MKKKNTDGLQQELMDSPDLSQFLSQNQEQFENKSVAELLNRLFEKKHISKVIFIQRKSTKPPGGSGGKAPWRFFPPFLCGKKGGAARHERI